MIIVITGWFDVYNKQGIPTGKKEWGVSHGIDAYTMKNVILPTERDPRLLGAVFDNDLGEWVIRD